MYVVWWWHHGSVRWDGFDDYTRARAYVTALLDSASGAPAAITWQATRDGAFLLFDDFTPGEPLFDHPGPRTEALWLQAANELYGL